MFVSTIHCPFFFSYEYNHLLFVVLILFKDPGTILP